jgi:hypothetical protein
VLRASGRFRDVIEPLVNPAAVRAVYMSGNGLFALGPSPDSHLNTHSRTGQQMSKKKLPHEFANAPTEMCNKFT